MYIDLLSNDVPEQSDECRVWVGKRCLEEGRHQGNCVMYPSETSVRHIGDLGPAD